MSVRAIVAVVLVKTPAAKTSARSGWDRDPSLGFPRTLIIRGRKCRLRHELEAFKTRSIAATASGGAATTAPNPHRRLAKKPQCVGGVVTG